MNNRTEILEEIKNAFSNVAYPGDDFIFETPPEGNWEDPEEQAMKKALVGRNWAEATPVLTELIFDGMIHFLTPQAFRYYLPGYLIAILDYQGPSTFPWVLAEKFNYGSLGIELLSHEQRQVVAKVFRILLNSIARDDDILEGHLVHALKQNWAKNL